MGNIAAVIAIALTTIFTVIGDSYLKKAGTHLNNFKNSDFLIGFLVYAITAFLWVGIYKITKFSLSGVVYSLMGMAVFVVIGVFRFGEELSLPEYVGIGMALSSIFLLSRFL